MIHRSTVKRGEKSRERRNLGKWAGGASVRPDWGFEGGFGVWDVHTDLRAVVAIEDGYTCLFRIMVRSPLEERDRRSELQPCISRACEAGTIPPLKQE